MWKCGGIAVQLDVAFVFSFEYIKRILRYIFYNMQSIYCIIYLKNIIWKLHKKYEGVWFR